MARTAAEPANAQVDPVDTASDGASGSLGSYYSGSMEHILAELERVDLMIQAQVHRARERHRVDEQFQGLVISEQEVDELLARPAGQPHFARSSPEGWAAVQDALAGVERQI